MIQALTAFSKRRPAQVLFLVAMLIRVVFFLLAVSVGPTFYLTLDSVRYDRLALNLIHRQQFKAEAFTLDELGLDEDFEERRLHSRINDRIGPGYLTDESYANGPDVKPEVKRVPLFVGFLALIYLVCGFSHGSVLFIQAVLSSVTCLLLYNVGLRLKRPDTGLLAGYLLAVNPRSLLHVGQIQVEVFYIFLLVCMAFMMLKFVQIPTWRNTIFFSITLGCVTFAREMGCYAVVLCLPAILAPAFPVSIDKMKRLLPKQILLICVPVLIIGAWMARNHHHYGIYFYSAHTVFSKVWWFAPDTIKVLHDLDSHSARIYLMEEIVEQFPEYADHLEKLQGDPSYFWRLQDDVIFLKDVETVAEKYYVKHLGTTASAFFLGAAWSMWSGLGEWRGILISPVEYEGMKAKIAEIKDRLLKRELLPFFKSLMSGFKILPGRAIAVFSVLWILCGVLYFTSVFGILPMWLENRVFAVELVIIIGFCAAVSGSGGNNRLFAMAYPFISVLSAFGIQNLIQRIRWFCERKAEDSSF